MAVMSHSSSKPGGKCLKKSDRLVNDDEQPLISGLSLSKYHCAPSATSKATQKAERRRDKALQKIVNRSSKSASVSTDLGRASRGTCTNISGREGEDLLALDDLALPRSDSGLWSPTGLSVSATQPPQEGGRIRASPC